MSRLRPLLSVVEQYRSDLQTLATVRLELLNLSVVLAAVQEEIGAYDYEELQQRVLLLETRLHSCMNKLGTGNSDWSSVGHMCHMSVQYVLFPLNRLPLAAQVTFTSNATHNMSTHCCLTFHKLHCMCRYKLYILISGLTRCVCPFL